MDSLHRAHLERILENRRRRGVLATHPNRRGASTATQTQELELPEKTDASLMKSDLSPIPRGMSDYTMADEAARPVPHPQQETQDRDAAEGSFNDGVRKMGNGNRYGFPGTENHNRFSGHTSSANHRPSQYDGDRRFGNVGGDHRRDIYNSSSARRPSRKSPTLAGRNTYSGRSNHNYSASMSPRRTVPLLTYNSSDNSVFSPSRGREGSSRGGRRTPSRINNYTLPGKRDNSSRPYERRDRSHSDYNSGMNSHGFFGRPSQNDARNNSMGGYRSSPRRPNQSEGNGFLHKFPDDRNRQAAGSVIYTGREDSLGSPYGRPLPEPLLPQVSPHTNLERNGSMNPNNDAVGLPGTRTTMDLRTSVSILAGGDWFYKWNGKGTSVSPRWVWLGTQSHVLLWAHKETYETAFAGTMKLEKILQITSRELQQPDDHGIPQTYYVLLVETSKRVLQLATERREKADAWYEALNNVLLYLRSHNFGAIGATSS